MADASGAHLDPNVRVESWGMAQWARSDVGHPGSGDEVREILARAAREGRTVALRGAGCSYGDAALNDGGIAIDFSRMNRILAFDPGTGVMTVQPGVTIEQVWRRALPHGWWPAVVPGTMFATIGGCAAMNVHGKNNFRAGTTGRHVESFELLLTDGSVLTCSREENPDVFHAAIGGFGMLGTFLSLTIRLHRVKSGNLEVKPISCRSLKEMTGTIDELQDSSDYLVGWLDAFPAGDRLGRGLIHQARYLSEADDPNSGGSLLPENQELPKRFFGTIPKSWMWRGLWMLLNRPGMRLVNAAKFHAGRLHARHGAHRQSLVGFSFLLDYVPDWKYAYRPGGLIQYQSFIPRDSACAAYGRLLDLSREAGIRPFLGVLKRHKPDPFLMTHAVDGFSLALDFPVTKRNRARLWDLAHRMDPVVTDAGGRFYFAKDSTLTTAAVERAWPRETLDRFLDLKLRLDPELRLQTDLFKRLFIPLVRSRRPATGP